jgi:hypothetical protein
VLTWGMELALVSEAEVELLLVLGGVFFRAEGWIVVFFLKGGWISCQSESGA